MKAVVRIGAHQHLVEEGSTLVVDRMEVPDETVFDQVLLTISDSAVEVGSPYLPDTGVMVRKVEDLKGEKVRIFKFKAKSRYRKTLGFRPQLTKFEVLSIGKPIVSAPASKPKAVKKTRSKKSENKS